MLLPSTCPVCGVTVTGRCRACWGGLERSSTLSIAPFAHTGDARRLVLGLKFRNARHVAAGLAEHMVAALDDPTAVDVVTWAPTSARRIADRGYDPAELLARAVARRLQRPCRRLLRRSRRSPPQSGRTRAERLVGPEFRARPLFRPLRVLVIDDVTTTGATLRRAAEALTRSGAREVRCLAATARPAGVPR